MFLSIFSFNWLCTCYHCFSFYVLAVYLLPLFQFLCVGCVLVTIVLVSMCWVCFTEIPISYHVSVRNCAVPSVRILSFPFLLNLYRIKMVLFMKIPAR